MTLESLPYVLIGTGATILVLIALYLAFSAHWIFGLAVFATICLFTGIVLHEDCF